MYNSIYKFAGLQVRLHDRVHQQDLDRRLPRRRAAGGHLRDRADDGRPRRRAGPGPARDPRAELDQARGVPVHHRRRAARTTAGNYEAATAKAKELFDYDGLRAEQAERRAPARTRSSSASASRRTPRCADWRRPACSGSLSLRRRRLGARADPDAADRQGRGGRGRQPARPGARDRVQPDRRRPARACRSRTSRSCTATPRWRPKGWTRTAPARSSSAASPWSHAVDKVIEKAKRFAAHLLEASADDIEFAAGSFRVSGTDKGTTSADVAFAVFDAHNLPAGVEPNLDAEATFDPVKFSLPARHAPVRASRWTPRPGGRDPRSTSAVDDVGNVVNPLIVDGQVHGGLAQGVAQALFEEAVYDESGTLDDGDVRRLPPAERGGPAQLDDRPHRVAGDDQRARRQGRRRDRHDRVDPGRGERDRRRAAALRRRRHRDAGDAERVWRAIQPARRRGRRRTCRPATPDEELLGGGARGGRDRPGVRGGARRRATRRRRREPVIPAAFDYEAPASVEEALSLLAGRGRREVQGARRRPEPAARCCGCGWRRPSWSSTSAGSRSCAASATRATSSSSAR